MLPFFVVWVTVYCMCVVNALTIGLGWDWNNRITNRKEARQYFRRVLMTTFVYGPIWFIAYPIYGIRKAVEWYKELPSE